MAKNAKDSGRSNVGYGATYQKGAVGTMDSSNSIAAVFGGQTWMVKPDKKARIANPCLWMQTGVVANKSCTNYYDCVSCKYDHGMTRQVAKGKQISWQQAMRTRPNLERTCRHSLTNRIPKRLCAYDYQCASCDFDQVFEDTLSHRTRSFPADVQQIKGFDVPMGHYFHNGHTWARIESGGHIRVGLDDFSLKLLGKADALDLPLMGKELDQGVAGWGLRRGENNADVLSPIDGVILEVNDKVRENPAIANDEPYGNGWLFTVHTRDVKGALKQLMVDADSLGWINAEVDTLENMIEEVTGPLAADGGHLATDIYGNLPDLDWNSLTSTFLKS